MPRIYNLNSHKVIRKQLRNDPTPAEQLLWRYLKNDQLDGYRFRRQFGMGRYIVDFYCPKLRLAIEIDGGIHNSDSAKESDHLRQEYIESHYIRVLRFRNDEIQNHVLKVVQQIRWAMTSPSATPNPPSEFRRGTGGSNF